MKFEIAEETHAPDHFDMIFVYCLICAAIDIVIHMSALRNDSLPAAFSSSFCPTIFSFSSGKALELVGLTESHLLFF